MRVPARFLKISSTADGAPSREGWLEIDIRALDLDGVTKLHVDLAEVEKVKSRRAEATDKLDAWDALFGKSDEASPKEDQ